MTASALGARPLTGAGSGAVRFEVAGAYVVDHATRLGYSFYSNEGATKALARILSGRDPLHHYSGSSVRYNRALSERTS